MLSSGLVKLVNSLKIKKYREKHNLFVVEGQKLVNDLLLTKAKFKQIITTNPNFSVRDIQIEYVKSSEIKKISFLKNPSDVLALVEIPQSNLSFSEINHIITLALDDIQDPGNMGTIIRIANWFGVENILCSIGCVDVYNPKVVQASMGAIMGVKVHYVNLEKSINSLKQFGEYNVYGTFMSGENIYSKALPSKGLVVMGNEGQGISKDISKLIDYKLTIPGKATALSGTESLNVGVATGIVLSEFMRA